MSAQSLKVGKLYSASMLIVCLSLFRWINRRQLNEFHNNC